MRPALLALVLAACGKSPEECRTYATDLGGLLERAAEEPPPFLSVREGRVGFFTARGPLRAGDGVAFDLEKGQTRGIVGESGSGKSVLVRSLIGLVGESSGAEVGGQVQFEGRDLRALPGP